MVCVQGLGVFGKKAKPYQCFFSLTSFILLFIIYLFIYLPSYLLCVWFWSKDKF